MYKVSKLAAGSVIAATAAIGCAGVALADGYEPRRVAYERPMDWSGVYFGVSSGYQWSNIDFNPVGNPGAGYNVDHHDAILGAHIGYQHQFGAVVLGVEGNWISSLRDTETSVSCVNPAFNCFARFNDVLTAGARAGWAAGRWMPYVTGGYARGSFENFSRAAAPPNTLFDTGHTDHNGWYIGGGLEWAVSPGWTAGLEYRHYEFNSQDVRLFTPAGALSGDFRHVDPTTDSVAARVSWRWGRPEAAPLK